MGDFNIDYIFDYANDYTFGTEEQEGYGRGGGLSAILANSITEELIWGHGFDKVYLTSYESFDDSKFGLMGKGSVSGITGLIISYGLVFPSIFILYSISLLSFISNFKYKIILLLFMLWELVLYKGTLTMGFFHFNIFHANNNTLI